MAGCYGNHPEDRYYEKMLDDYLDRIYPADTSEEDYEEEEQQEYETD